MIDPPRFSNRQNERLEVTPGRTLFHSRSLAVTAVVLAHDAASQTFHALVGERGPAVDHSGAWCLVCGYLDWDESLPDAVRREVFEEAGIDLRALEAAGQAVVPDHPLFLQSDPQSHRQNVTARFPVELASRVAPSTQNAEPGEVVQSKWIEVARAEIALLPWAFHHDAILGELADWYDAERVRGVLDAASTRRFYRSRIETRYPFA